MQSWKIRLGLMLAMLAMLLMVSVPVAVADDDEWDDWHGISDNWNGDHDDDDDDDEDHEGIELASFDLDAEVVCWYDGNWDELDGWDNDGDFEIDEGDIDCELVWDD